MSAPSMLPKALSVCAGVELILVIAEDAIPWCAHYLPLGGSHLAQIGILFGLPFAVIEILQALGRRSTG